MVKGETRSAEIARSARADGRSHRVIGTDGVERDIVGSANWIAAVRSNTVDDGCLFFDPESRRWRPLPDLEMYSAAVARVDGPRNLSAAMQGSATETHVWQGSESRALLFAARGLLARSAPVWWFVVVVGTVALLAWAAGLSLSSDLEFAARSVPPPALIVGVVCILILLAEEFHWFALRLVGVTTSRLTERLGVQVGALLTAALTSYIALGQISLTAPEVALLGFVRNAVAVGGIYALSVFLWSLLLITSSSSAATRKALASVLVAAMLIGSLYMALAPSVRHFKPPESLQLEQRR